MGADVGRAAVDSVGDAEGAGDVLVGRDVGAAVGAEGGAMEVGEVGAGGEVVGSVVGSVVGEVGLAVACGVGGRTPGQCKRRYALDGKGPFEAIDLLKVGVLNN